MWRARSRFASSINGRFSASLNIFHSAPLVKNNKNIREISHITLFGAKSRNSPRRLLISELCIFGFSWANFRLCPRDLEKQRLQDTETANSVTKDCKTTVSIFKSANWLNEIFSYQTIKAFIGRLMCPSPFSLPPAEDFGDVGEFDISMIRNPRKPQFRGNEEVRKNPLNRKKPPNHQFIVSPNGQKIQIRQRLQSRMSFDLIRKAKSINWVISFNIVTTRWPLRLAGILSAHKPRIGCV